MSESARVAATKLLPNVYLLGYKTGKLISEILHSSWHSLSEKYTLSATWNLITSFPALYKEWWINLYANDPTHVYVETTLLLAIVYFLVSRRSNDDWRKREKEKLTRVEEEELLQEWKRTRQPLAPPQMKEEDYFTTSSDDSDEKRNLSSSTTNNTSAVQAVYADLYNDIVVHKCNGRYMEVELYGEPERRTVLNFATFDFLGMSNEDALANHQEQDKNEKKKDSKQDNTMIPKIESPSSLDQIQNPVKKAALAALDRYGCGSCGPRGFYGTIDVHLKLEEQFAAWMQTDGAILYSDAASTCSSTIAAFCKRGDLLVVDEAIQEPLQTGVLLSRANIKWFKHNDMKDLRRVLEQVNQADTQLGRKPNAQRRFIVVEGLYKNTGTVCPLDELVKLKHEFHYRLILDESYSFGTLGKTGRGCAELYGLRLMYDAEIVTVSLENTIGSIGGMTVGTDEVVDHQRLSGAGYCYSASSPPFTAAAAMEALNQIERRPGLLQRLHENRVYLYKQLSDLLTNKLEDLLFITSDERSPIVMLQVADNIPETEYLDEMVFLEEVVRECLYNGVALVACGPKFEENTSPVSVALKTKRTNDPPPGIRMTITAAHTKTDIDRMLLALCDSVDVVMNRFHEETIERNDRK